MKIAAFAIFVAIAAGFAGTADATPKKALGDYSKLCKDEHFACLNDCQRNYPNSSDADMMVCFKVCEDWLDDSCDVVFPKAKRARDGVKRPGNKGVLDPGPQKRPKPRPEVAPKAEELIE